MPSLMNGLSAAGSAISSFASSAGLEEQKAMLQERAMTLSNQLQHQSKTEEIAQQGGIQSGIVGQQTASAQQVANIGAGATLGAAGLYAGGQMGAARIAAEAQPPEVKLLAALGIPLPGLGKGPAPAAQTGAGAPPPPSPGTSAGAAEPSGTGGGGISQPSASPAVSAATSSIATQAPKNDFGTATDPLTQNLVYKALGLPTPGSEAADRMAIASDVRSDPNFRYASAGQQAAEVETRMAVAQGKLTDPASREAMAKLIANYQIDQLTGYALNKPGGPETMALVQKINPDYNEQRFKQIKDAMDKFGSGQLGNQVRFANVGVQHLEVLDQAAQQLGNGSFRPGNDMVNYFKQQFGAPAPTTFDALKQIVGTEIEKAVAGGIGAATDRERLMTALDRANSPEQLQATTDAFRSLMVGQLVGLKREYEDATGFKQGPFAFVNKLEPATIARLGLDATGAPQAAPKPPVIEAAPTDPGDRKVGQSYKVPDGRSLTWGGTGWQPPPDTGMGAGSALTLGLTP